MTIQQTNPYVPVPDPAPQAPAPSSVARPPVAPAGVAWPPAAPTSPPRQGAPVWLAVSALVMSTVALLAVLAVGVFVALASAGGGPDETMRGQLTSDPAGAAVPAATLDADVSRVVSSDSGGAEVNQMSCPVTPAVKQGVVTVCHGAVDGEDWAIIVYFEDARGTFTLDMA